jgi:hypothetical protein
MIEIKKRRKFTMHQANDDEDQHEQRPEDFECLYWVQTGNCDPIHGPIESQKPCNETIQAGVSGYKIYISYGHLIPSMYCDIYIYIYAYIYT